MLPSCITTVVTHILLAICIACATSAPPACNLAGRWVMVSPDFYSMARVQFCVYAIEETPASDAFVITKVDEAGGCWGDVPCCGWWSTATGSRASSQLNITFTAPNGTTVHESGFVQPSCSTLDLSSGHMLARSNVSVWDMDPLVWLKTMTALTVRAARQTASDGTVLLSPGWPAHYGGQFVRDAFYGTANALDLLPNVSQARRATEWVYARQRAADGAMPQMVRTSGQPEYSQTCVHDSLPVDNGTRCVVSDSAPFAVKSAAVWTLADTSSPPAARRAWFRSVAAALARAMNATPTRDDLAWSDPQHPIVGYGFTDTVIKSGHTLYSSVLYFEACELMAEMATFASSSSAPGDGVGGSDKHLRAMATRFRVQAQRTRQAINERFWDAGRGGYRASTGVEVDRIDVWGTGLAAFLNVSNATQSEQIFRFFARNRRRLFFEGQLRQVVAPHRWDVMRGPRSRDWTEGWDGALDHVYQNGCARGHLNGKWFRVYL